jgi:hypothetical protein
MVPAVTITVFKYRNKIGKTVVKAVPQPEPLNGNESGRFGALKSDSTHNFLRNACTKSGSLRIHSFPVVD